MAKRYRAVARIHHSSVEFDRAARQSRVAGFGGLHQDTITIEPGQVFFPSDFKMTNDEVARLEKVGHIHDADDLDMIRPAIANDGKPRVTQTRSAEETPT